MMICVVPGVVLAAAYMLRMLQKVAYGGTRNPDHSHVERSGPAGNCDAGALAGVRVLDWACTPSLSPGSCMRSCPAVAIANHCHASRHQHEPAPGRSHSTIG